MIANYRNKLRARRNDRLGFTLMEVLLVLVILVVLASLAVQTYRGVQDKALKDAAKTKVGLISGSVDTYQIHMFSFPGNLQDLINKPNDARAAEKWSGPYLKDANALSDPWGNELRYAAPGKHNSDSFDIWSIGPDGQDGTSDDIGNWQT
jgi:general secretion pathway protein G